MNLVVGIMCQTSLEVTKKDQQVNRNLVLVKKFKAEILHPSVKGGTFAMVTISGGTELTK